MVKKESKSVRILNLIEERGAMRFTDIQAALWAMSHTEPFTRELRGYWCTNLCGGRTADPRLPFYQSGLLYTFCTKGDDGLWRRNNIPHNNAPWRTMRSMKLAEPHASHLDYLKKYVW